MSDLAMLFNWYGVLNTPQGSPLNSYPPFQNGLRGEPMDPGSFNYAMANYKTSASTIGSIGLNGSNDIDWKGAAEVARASRQGAVSYSKNLSLSGSEKDAITAVQNEICAGNAVIMKVSSPSSTAGQHFLLAKAIGVDGDKNQTLVVNNPGDSFTGENKFYSSLKSTYPSFLSYIVYHNSLTDPSTLWRQRMFIWL